MVATSVSAIIPGFRYPRVGGLSVGIGIAEPLRCNPPWQVIFDADWSSWKKTIIGIDGMRTRRGHLRDGLGR